jgi:peptidoglycan/LPS O-acetylase OafA/YrhL
MNLSNHTQTAPAHPAEFLSTRPLAAPVAVDNVNLDFLRSVAVLLVFVGHLTNFHGLLTFGPFHLILMGTLGVMLFFVHTCLVLLLSLERRWKRYFQGLPDKISACWVFFIEFMMRRCFRIYPLSITAILLILLFRLPLVSVEPGHFSGMTPDTGDVIANLFLVQNISMRTSLLGPIWSLPYELQMYLFLPWLFLFLIPRASKWRVAAIWFVSVCFALLVMRYRPNPSLLLFLPCFLPGAIAYQLQRTVRPRLPAHLWPFMVLIPAALFLCAKPGMNWLEKWVTCLFISLAIPMFRQISHRWLVAPAHWIAKYSYGVYLTHFFSIWFAFERLGKLPLAQRIAVFLVLAVGLPVLFYHLIEQPMIDFGKGLTDRFVREKLSPVAASRAAVEL